MYRMRSCQVLLNEYCIVMYVTPKFYTVVLHHTLNPTAELWCKTLSRVKVGLVLHRTYALEVYLHLPI